jgi:uncharacterized protein (DUF697 family)
MSQGIDRAKKFWKTTKEFSIAGIVQEAARPFNIAIVGTPEKREQILRHLFPGYSEDDVIPERSLVKAFESTSEESGFPQDAGPEYLVIDAGDGRSLATIGTPIYSISELGDWERVSERILDQRPDLALSLARRFPGLRPAVSERIIKDAARANAEFAMLNALPGVIPIVAPLLPVASIGDIFMLTKNQAMMLYKLAAIHELPLDMRSRSKDMAPLLGNAFGWRAIARELIGMVPGGVGLVARGAIAYAGTMALGKALLRFYQTGEKPTRAVFKELYEEASESAKEIARGTLKAIQSRGKRPAAIEPADGSVELVTSDTPVIAGADKEAID